MSAQGSNTESNRFFDGDVAFLSTDGMIFKIKSFNLEFTSTGFPPGIMKCNQDPMPIPLEEDSKTLDIVFSFSYPDLPLPEMQNLSFQDLLKVVNAADKYGLQHGLEMTFGHLYKFVPTYPSEILAIAVKQDSSALMTAVAPYMVSLSVKELCSVGVSNRLAVKWGIYREEWISALLTAQKDLGQHDSCLLWRQEVKPRLHERLFTTTGTTVVPVQKYQTEGQLTVQGIWAETLEWLRGKQTTRMVCCVEAMEYWALSTLHGLALVEFPA